MAASNPQIPCGRRKQFRTTNWVAPQPLLGGDTFPRAGAPGPPLSKQCWKKSEKRPLAQREVVFLSSRSMSNIGASSKKEVAFLPVLLISVLLVVFAPPVFSEDKIAVKTDGVEIKFNALTQIWITGNFQRPRSLSEVHTYKLRRSELSFSGNIKGAKVHWFVMLDPAERPTSPLQDLYVTLRYVPKTEFRAGQFKIPFSTEGLTPSGQLDFVERTKIVQTFANSRDIGITFHGKFRYWEWQAGEFNGNGQNATDNNGMKDFVARVLIKPVHNVSFGISGHYGSITDFIYDSKKNTIRNGYNHLYGVASVMEVDLRKVKFVAEAIWRRDDSSKFVDPPVIVTTVQKKRWGGYSSLIYRFIEKHQLGTRFEWFDPKTDIGRDAIFIGTLGYNFLLSEHVKWQINLWSQVEQRGNLDNTNTYFGAINLQISF